MSKLSKTDLKVIVKECLIEILAEGLVQNRKSQVNTRKKNQLKESLIQSKTHSQAESSNRNKRMSYLDNIKFNTQNDNQKSNVNERAKNLAAAVTSDPILNEILIDTAQTTMREQVSADNSRGFSEMQRPADHAASIVDSANPDELFGEAAASKWATLAFGK